VPQRKILTLSLIRHSIYWLVYYWHIAKTLYPTLSSSHTSLWLYAYFMITSITSGEDSRLANKSSDGVTFQSAPNEITDLAS
jgi:hypothetical protein